MKSIIFGQINSGKSTYATSRSNEPGKKLFRHEELRNANQAREFLLTGRAGDITTLHSGSAETARERFLELVGSESADLTDIEFVPVPAWLPVGIAA